MLGGGFMLLRGDESLQGGKVGVAIKEMASTNHKVRVSISCSI